VGGCRIKLSLEAPNAPGQARHLQYRSRRAIHQRGVHQGTADHRIAISTDGRGRCHDNIFVERLWWTVKHEWVYLHPAADGIEQKRSHGEFFDWYGGAVNLWTVGCAEPRRNGRAA
jgi:transposase InsO family protein